jgi:hypothetical protein
MANQRSLGTPLALFIAMRQLVLHGLPTTRARIRSGIFFDGLSLAGEDLTVDPEQILTFHTLFARDTTNEKRPVNPGKPFREIGRRHNAAYQRKCAVLEFHHCSFECCQGLWNFDEMKLHWLVPDRASNRKRCGKATNNPSGLRPQVTAILTGDFIFLAWKAQGI